MEAPPKPGQPEKGAMPPTKLSPDPSNKRQKNPLTAPPQPMRRRISNPCAEDAMDALYLDPSY
jgi:hypothetical protein